MQPERCRHQTEHEGSRTVQPDMQHQTRPQTTAFYDLSTLFTCSTHVLSSPLLILSTIISRNVSMLVPGTTDRNSLKHVIVKHVVITDCTCCVAPLVVRVLQRQAADRLVITLQQLVVRIDVRSRTAAGVVF